MSRSLTALIVAATLLTGCGTVRDSALNPFNWFGQDREVRTQPVSDNPLIPEQRDGLLRRARDAAEVYRGQPVDTITSVQIERTPGGAIVRAEGVSRFLNTYDVQLTRDDSGDAAGVLAFRLESVVPESAIAAGSERQRTIIAARALTDQDLAGIRVIRIEGAGNAREIRRR